MGCLIVSCGSSYVVRVPFEVVFGLAKSIPMIEAAIMCLRSRLGEENGKWFQGGAIAVEEKRLTGAAKENYQ